MELGQNVRVINVGDTLSPKLKKGHDAKAYPRMEPGAQKIVPWSTAVLWLGNPEQEGQHGEMEVTRIRAFYGCVMDDSILGAMLPNFEVYDLESGDRVVTVCDILLEKDVTLPNSTEPTEDHAYVIAELRRLKAENEQFARQLSAVQAGKSVHSVDVITPADEPEPSGATSADTPQSAKTSLSTKKG